MEDYAIKNYKPVSLFHFFEDISAIPRGSKNEAAIADYLVRFATERGLSHYRDEFNNVLITAPATPGYEKEPAILFQGHTDMVCEKNSDTTHDFLTDPLDLYVEDGWLRARGTTLGADNGVAVAVMLALLDGEAAEHPMLECLFTSEEEIGLTGAKNFDYSKITARRMINMDVDGEGKAVVGCSGGCRTDILLPLEFAPAAGQATLLKVGGLMGGHSGIDIGSGRANANKVMGRILLALRHEVDYNLISITGGLAENAIPRECEAVITSHDYETIKSKALPIAAAIAEELCDDDVGFAFSAVRVQTPELMMKCSGTRRVADMIGVFENGVLRMSDDMPGLVEYSRNLGVIRTEADGVRLSVSSRSAIESQIDASIDYLDAFAELCCASAEHYNRYPGWKFEKISPLRDKYTAVCQKVLSREPEILAIHAGLECGIIKSKVPDMDIIAIGPDLANLHTPEEKLNLSSFERFWLLILGMLRK